MEYSADAFLKVKLEEITPANIRVEGPNTYLVIEWRGVAIKARRICAVGYVKEVRNKGRFTDVVLERGGATALVRVWEEKSDLLAKLEENAPVKVMGVLRSYRETPYVAPVIIRRVSPSFVEWFEHKILEDRDQIVNYVLRIEKSENET